MKTKEQILKWLDAQPWAKEFYKEAFLDRALDFYFSDTLLAGAFKWNKTTQGAEVWRERSRAYQKWYDSNEKPMSWEEYCEQNPIKEGAYYLDWICQLQQTDPRRRNEIADANVMSKDLCEAFLAYMKLHQLRIAWVKDCEGNRNCKILVVDGKMCVLSRPLCSAGLSSPTEKMSREFMDTFKDLLEIAKPLL